MYQLRSVCHLSCILRLFVHYLHKIMNCIGVQTKRVSSGKAIVFSCDLVVCAANDIFSSLLLINELSGRQCISTYMSDFTTKGRFICPLTLALFTKATLHIKAICYFSLQKQSCCYFNHAQIRAYFSVMFYLRRFAVSYHCAFKTVAR